MNIILRLGDKGNGESSKVKKFLPEFNFDL